MKKLAALMMVISVLSILCSTESSAIRRRGGGGWGAKTQYGQLFNPKTLETISGEVVAVERFTPLRGMSWGLRVMLRTDREIIAVHVGPGWYSDELGLTLEPKDQITVTGSRISFMGAPAIIATEVRKGDQVFALRRDDGVPVWSEE